MTRVGETISREFEDLRIYSNIDTNLHEKYVSGVIDWIPELKFDEENNSLYINDPVWGEEIIGDQEGDELLLELIRHPAVQRSRDIEQLTLPKEYTTIPNTSYLKRIEHELGILELTRKICRQNDISPKESLIFQLRALVSDLAHSTGSHLGDWACQDDHREENLHEHELYKYMDYTGLNKIIEEYGIDPYEITSPKQPDWLEDKLPNLCVDRVDYGLREMKRWIPDRRLLRRITSDDFYINEQGQMFMTDLDKAKIFAESFLELGREHWNEPIHRLQLNLYLLRSKRIHTAEHGHRIEWLEFHPRDIMYCSDEEYAMAMEEYDEFSFVLGTILRDIGQHERNFGWMTRERRVERRISNLPEIHSQGEFDKNIPHHSVSIEELKTLCEEDENCFTLLLPHLKIRQIDPLVEIDGEIIRLSKVDPVFAHKLIEHRQEMSKDYIARIGVPNNEKREFIKREILKTESTWKELQSRPRATRDKFNTIIDSAGRAATVLSQVRIVGLD